MAGRPPKENLEFSSWEVDLFDNEPKIDKLIDGQGATAFTIFFFLCQRAYGSKGYFYKWGYDDAATTARKIGGGVGSEQVIETVKLCLRIGLFDNRLFVEHGIITGRCIQKMFWKVAKDRTYNTIKSEFWLLEDGPEFNKSRPKNNYDGSIFNNDTPKLNNVEQKKSKEKESKDISKDISAASADSIPYGKILDYLNQKSEKRFKLSDATRGHIRARWNEGFRFDDFIKVIDNRVSEWKNDSVMAQYIRPATLFGTKFEGYLNDYKPDQSKSKKNNDLMKLASRR